MNILEEIIANKRLEVESRKAALPMGKLLAQAENATPRPGFVEALRSVPMGLVAEVKRRSPSAGMIRDPFDPAGIAKDYEAHGAQAISCLMDGKYFGGGEKDFAMVRQATGLPMLYKEFVVDEWQVAHARVMGASAVLLIVGALESDDLVRLIQSVNEVGLCPLVEVHDREEMLRAIDAGAGCIGINNRNLKTFVTTLETTFSLVAMAPKECTLISESGIKTPDDVAQLKKAGAHGILVGESLLREASPGLAAACLMGRA